MPIFDYICVNSQCASHNQLTEVLVRASEVGHPVACDVCNHIMKPQVAAPRGYVVGSRNPVKQ